MTSLSEDLGKKIWQSTTLHLAKISFKTKCKIKTFVGIQKLKEFIISRPGIQEILKEVFRVEEKMILAENLDQHEGMKSTRNGHMDKYKKSFSY